MNVLLKLEKISKIYGFFPNEVYALKDISLTVKKGEFLAIIGPSGSGKSTLMNLLGCLDKPSHGKYFLDGKQVSQLSDNQLAQIRNERIGFIFQSFNLLPRTSSTKNVLLPLTYSNFPKGQRIKKAQEMLTKVGLAEKFTSTPAQLSGGQQQRVAIARALVNNPSIILADEPTGNLDTKSSHEIMNMLKDLNNEGRTVIIITHEQEVAEFAQRIITIRDGKIESDKKSRGKNKYLKRK